MKDYYRTVAVFAILYLAAVLAFVIITGRGMSGFSGRDNEIVVLNDIAKDAEALWDDTDKLDGRDYGIDYALIDTTDNLLYKSYQDEDEEISLSSAMKSGRLYSCVSVNDKLAGYVILRSGGSSMLRSLRTGLIVGLAVFGTVLLAVALLFGRYVDKSIITPFSELESFAGSIAEGDLDRPLQMHRSNMFGAFTESFDIMREELGASRKREIDLQRRERELVASLSHDLKTPITGIKVTCELLKTKLESGGEGMSPDPGDLYEKIDNIYRKTDQIDVLVSDLFSSTMEDLDELKVTCTDVSSKVLGDIIHRYDDREKVTVGYIPEVLIHIDIRRMGQVIGNIISNSYKYAGTPIEISCRLVDEYLEMDIKDFGPGVPADEINLITNKFYRGRQWAQSAEDGSGLGLYIAAMLMEKMDGGLVPVSPGEGLTITLMIPLC